MSESSKAAETDYPDPMDDMRLMWKPPTANEGFIRKWLVCGPFPIPPQEGQDTHDPMPSGAGLATDYLKQHGGEVMIRPVAGMIHKRSDGSEARWREVVSDTDKLDLKALFEKEGSTDNCVAYAYATVERDKAGPAYLTLGSDDGARVWVSGALVHEVLIQRGVRADNDIVPVTLQKGSNTILAKVETGGGGWGLCLRVVDSLHELSLQPRRPTPVFDPPLAPEAETWVIRTGHGFAPAEIPVPSLTLEIVAPGNRVVAQRNNVRMGESVTFDVAKLPEGPYGVRITARTEDGEQGSMYRRAYKGDWKELAKEMLNSAERLPDEATDRKTLVLKHLARIILFRAGGDPRTMKTADGKPLELPSMPTWPLFRTLMEYAELKGDSAVGPHGFVRLAWVDPVDGSSQFASASLPREYDSKKKWPLLIWLHGYDPSNTPYVQGWLRGGGGLDPEGGMIELWPFGRGNTGYQGIGEQDVLTAIRKTKQMLSVDDDRVYLAGGSMGGGGTWFLGSCHPELFAAIAPVYGGWDYHARISREEMAKLTPRQKYLQERRSTFAQFEALLTMPIFVNHGDSDMSVTVNYSRYAVEMLQRWGYNVRYWEHPGWGHSDPGCKPAIMRFFRRHKRNANPEQVRLRSAHLRLAKSYWVRVEQRKDPWAFMRVDARVTDRRTVRMDTGNVLQIRLSPGDALVDTEEKLHVFWNGKYAGEHAFKDGAVMLRAPGYVASKGCKTPQVAGPLDEVKNTPFAIVVGTASKAPLMRAFCRLRAEADRDGWKTWQHVEPRYFLDRDVTDEHISKYSLILYGGPDENLVTRKLAKDLPIALGPDTITVGGQRFDAEDAAVAMAHPNPKNPERYVAVVAANSPRAMYFSNQLPWEFDFAINSPGRYKGEEEHVPGEKLGVVRGFFDHDWKYDEAYVDRGDPAYRAQVVPFKAPRRVMARCEDELLWLSELLETSASGSFRHMARDVNRQGDPIRLGGETYERGIAVDCWRQPCFAQYDLAGCGWKRLRAVIGIETWDELSDLNKENTLIVFRVLGDGRELYRSPTFRWNSDPVDIDVDIHGVKDLELRVANEVLMRHCAVSSVNWADLRLEK